MEKLVERLIPGFCLWRPESRSWVGAPKLAAIRDDIAQA